MYTFVCTYTNVYIYICVCVYVCIYIYKLKREQPGRLVVYIDRLLQRRNHSDS